jgi:hypothetical protein
MADVTFTESEVEALGAKLGGFDEHFTNEERALLSSLLARGLQGLNEDAEADVQGFLLLPAVQKVREAAARMSVTPGATPGATHGIIAVNVEPGAALSLNFTKIGGSY